MTLVTGYLPIPLTESQHEIHKTELSKHYTTEYFTFEELQERDNLPIYYDLRAMREGVLGLCYRDFDDRWAWYESFPTYRTLSLLKLS